MDTFVSSPQQALNSPICIEYDVIGDPMVPSGFELLVVACDPRYLSCDYTSEELDIFHKLKNFQFHTSLLQVKRLEPLKHTVIFSPSILNAMSGEVYVYRNETAKQFGIDAANQMDENLVTVYQLYNPPNDVPMPEQEFICKLKNDLPLMKQRGWWPYDTCIDKDILCTVNTPYFNHFEAADIKNELPWKLLNLQGKNNTVYVHASTCFESIFDCWAYEKMIMQSEQVQKALPVDKSASIAIIGAGASGLLFAVELRRLKYKNITLLESTDRYGGKTHTIIEKGPYPPNNKQHTVCELGACYFTPMYNPMIADLQAYLQCNEEVDFAKDNPNFRAVVTTGGIINYNQYVIEIAKEKLKIDNDILLQAALAIEIVSYINMYEHVMGSGNQPMPSNPPANFLQQYGSSTFLELLQAKGLLGLVGILEYAYEVQGYGLLNKIPAFYGLVWITPQLMVAILLDAFIDFADHLIKLLDIYLPWPIPTIPEMPIVQAWKNGWQDMWDQIVSKEKLTILTEVRIQSIKRYQSDV